LAKLCSWGLHVLDAVVEVKDSRGKRLGDHDLILGIMRADVPATLCPRLPLSCEVKLRRLWSPTGQRTTRQAIQKGCLDDLAWWTQEAPKFSGRVLLMAVFPEKKGNKFDLCGDLRWNCSQRWIGLFGWDNALGSLAAALRARGVATVHSGPCAQTRRSLQAPTKPKAHGKARAKSLPQAPAPSASSLVDQLSFVNGVAEVKALLQAANKNVTKSGYWAQKAKSKHHWTNAQLYQQMRGLDTSTRGRKRDRGGGSQCWVGTRKVLVQMLKDMRVA
jgi:hypothetical protein